MTTQVTKMIQVIGIPEHLNQYLNEAKQNESLIKGLTELKTRQIISSKLGEIRDTAMMLDEEVVRVITVGLGNLKTLNEASYLEIWGNVFQYLKKSRDIGNFYCHSNVLCEIC